MSHVKMGDKPFPPAAGQAEPFETKPRKSKYVPTGIDPANPQKNFVEATFKNKGDDRGFSDYMYGRYDDKQGIFVNNDNRNNKKASGYGHSVANRSGKLRLSGSSGAHRIGKRSK